MSIRNLHHLFKPESVALIGASRKDGSVGRVIAENLFHAGFQGPILPVHPRHRAIEGVLSYGSVRDLPLTPDLAVIATPPDTVVDIVRELGERGTKAAVVITAGFGEGGREEGTRRRQALLEAARPHLMRIVGPNCVGIMMPGQGINASFSHIAPKQGDLAFVTQSGAIVTAMLDWATPRGIGFSHVVSLGDMSDVDFGDMLDYLARDGETRAILLYVEAITDARKFMSAARAAARTTPVIVIKGGRFAEGAKAASSHTGALAGSDDVYDAAFQRAGMLRVHSLDELFDAAETLSSPVAPAGERLAILTNGGGLGVLATDAVIDHGGKLAELGETTMARLDAVLPETWSRGNPVDIIGDAPGSRYAAALEALLEDEGTDAVLTLNCPTAVASSVEAARAVVTCLDGHTKHGKRAPVFTAWLGEHTARDARQEFARAEIPTYDTPEQAVRGVMHRVRYRRNQELLMRTPPSRPAHFEPDRESVRAALDAALEAERRWLTEPEAKAVLAAYQIPVVDTKTATTPDDAASAAAALDGPVALKIVSPDISHKSDVGGVVLDLGSPEEVRTAAERMVGRVRELQPEARVTGFSVQQMVRRPGAFELIVGASEDPQFGPVMLFGEGGTAVEAVGDRAIALPPLDLGLARSLIEQTRIYKLLRGYRDQPAAALDDIALTMVNLSQLVTDFAEIGELDINPLLADSRGVIALDARIRVQKAAGQASSRLAIRPYPQELEQQVELRDGETVFVRPIRPEDEPSLQAAFKRLDPEDVRLRFMRPLRELDHAYAAHLSQIDYDREMALVALPREGSDEVLGVVRISSDPDNRKAEYAVIVRSDLKGRGLGFELMRRILEYAERKGIGEIWGDVLTENHAMLRMCRELGFEVPSESRDPQIRRVRKRLRPGA